MLNSPVTLTCAKQRDLLIGGTYPQFWQLDAKCSSLDAKIVNKVQDDIHSTFRPEIGIGRILIHVTVQSFCSLNMQA